MSVGTGWDEPGFATHASGGARVVEELGDPFRPLVLERLGGHRHPGVICEQRDDPVDVAALKGGREALRELALSSDPGAGVRSRAGGMRASSAERARWSALLTVASVVSRVSATSEARKPSTSHSRALLSGAPEDAGAR